MKTGRNEPCSCGSGKKSKHCCQSTTGAASKSGITGMIIAGVAIAAAIAVIASTRGESTEGLATSSASQLAIPAQAPAAAPGAPLAAPAPATPGAQPPGPAPAGKVWSPEHGHWHDKARAANEWVTVTPQRTVPVNTTSGGLPVSVPAPKGPAPAGAVWSPEHGHWHDAKTGQAIKHDIPSDVAAQMKQPGLPANIKDYVWSEEHKHWHRKDAGGAEHETPMILPPPGGGTAPSSTAPPVSNPK